MQLNLMSRSLSRIKQLQLFFLRLPRQTPSKRMSTTAQLMEPYTLSPLPVFGVEAKGFDLKQPVPQETVEKIKQDVTEHRIVVFRDQGVVSGERQVEISEWFGELDDGLAKHPKSPHPKIYRVSNDRRDGCTNVGTSGWHIDGTYYERLYSHGVYHMIRVPKKGNTGEGCP